HIEQGPVLETESLQIGVVDCVVGMVCYEIEVTGDSDHAGTTPMPLRKDALFATNNLISEVRQKLSKMDDKLVYTIGRRDVSPNIHTLTPNKIVVSLDARHQDAETINQVEAIIQALPGSSGREKCEVKATTLWDRDTVWFDEKLVHSLEQSRSEEHTSELQSRFDLVCRLLLEKKNNRYY